MRAPVSWLSDFVDVSQLPSRDLADRLTAAGLQVEKIERTGADISNVVLARVVAIEELTGHKKPIRWVTLDDGDSERQVICGATNFAVDDVVAYARPPALLPGGFRVDKRKTYGRESDGMICSARELGLGDDHTGILVLGDASPLGADVVEVLGLRDTVLDIAVNPDRGYALSIRGVARELAIAFALPFRDPGLVQPADVAGGGYEVRIDDPAGCDRYVARTITDVDTEATSPAWMQRRLALAGMRPISLAVDVTNHVMLELGQPLHAFDRDTLRGPIVVRRARNGERLRTLDDVDRVLHPDDLLITDDSGPIALAGVMGGAATEIGDRTTAIVLEAAHFDPRSIAYTARRHRLGSEASRRFERGVDTELAAAAAQTAVDLLVRLGGAAPGGGTDAGAPRPRITIALDPALPGRLAGLTYPAERVRTRLTEIGCELVDGEVLSVRPPTWRPDLQRPEDLVEEVVRLEGYDQLPTTVPSAPAGRGLTRSQRQRRQVSRALAAAGFAEVLSYPFVSVTAADDLMLAPDDERRATVRLANPVSEEEPLLRATLLPGLFAALARNVGRGFPDVALFETGTVFRAPTDPVPMPHPPAGVRPTPDVLAAMEAALPEQPLHVAAVLAGAWERPGWWGPGRDAVWADAVAAAELVGSVVHVPLEVVAVARPPWHPGRCAELRAGGRQVGYAGELHPRVIEAMGLPPRACAMELSLQPVLALAPEIVPGPVVSAYPAASVDVALVVPADVPVGAVTATLREGAGPLLEALQLFDVYAGEQVGEGNRSLAFRLRLRATDRTLTVDEAVAQRDAAVALAHERFGATLRG